jgi:hypothetical protein
LQKATPQMTQTKKFKIKNLSESLYEGDLKWLVGDCVLIDMHKTKLDDDADYTVLSITVLDKPPAVDLAQFIESGVYKFEDVEVSPGTDLEGNYLVYVEIERSPEIFKTINGILSDVSKLSSVTEWKFKTLGLDDDIEFNEENFAQHVITSPLEYKKMHQTKVKTVSKESNNRVDESIQRLKDLLSY